jgi:hypothetical protein
MTTDLIQDMGRAIYERQRDLNELCLAVGCPLGTSFEEILNTVKIDHAEAKVSRVVDERLRELIPIWRYRALNPGQGSQHYQHGVATAWEDAARALKAALDGDL